MLAGSYHRRVYEDPGGFGALYLYASITYQISAMASFEHFLGNATVKGANNVAGCVLAAIDQNG